MRVVALAALLAGCGVHREEQGDTCCPPPEGSAGPALRTTDDGRCVQRWPTEPGCISVSVDPVLEGRALEIAEVLALWSAPGDDLPCFHDPELLDSPPGDGEHWLHMRPPSEFIADETLLFEGTTGTLRQASIELPADEFAQPLVFRIGRILGLERASDEVDSVMSGAPRPTDADRESLSWVYGPEATCE